MFRGPRFFRDRSRIEYSMADIGDRAVLAAESHGPIRSALRRSRIIRLEFIILSENTPTSPEIRSTPYRDNILPLEASPGTPKHTYATSPGAPEITGCPKKEILRGARSTALAGSNEKYLVIVECNGANHRRVNARVIYRTAVSAASVSQIYAQVFSRSVVFAGLLFSLQTMATLRIATRAVSVEWTNWVGTASPSEL